MADPIRVLLADDHPLVRAGIRAAVWAETDVALIGEATDRHQAQRMCLELQPDVLLLDLNMLVRLRVRPAEVYSISPWTKSVKVVYHTTN